MLSVFGYIVIFQSSLVLQNSNSTSMAASTGTTNNLQTGNIAGGKVQYVRLVSSSTAPPGTHTQYQTVQKLTRQKMQFD